MRTKSGMIKSRASKPKNFKWQNRERFSMGHDPASFALIPEKNPGRDAESSCGRASAAAKARTGDRGLAVAVVGQNQGRAGL